MSAAKTAKAAAIDPREQVVDAMFRLLETHDFKDITLPQIAREAGLSLGDLRGVVASKLDVLAAFTARIDRKVLDDLDGEMDDQPARDRLFDVLMARVDALMPYRKSLKNLRKAVMRDPGLALSVNGLALRSHRWMLTAAGLELTGLKAPIALQGLAISFARVVDVFLEEEDTGLPRTMAALDKELDRGEGWMQRVDGLERLARPVVRGLCRLAEKRAARRARRQEDGGDTAADVGDEATAPMA
ncbi:TetR/AcrR family transcriptional regulator [Pannonibacter sp.]|uniref:TetR/AcrR family transcriptional regulator n=1 Tax=Pannonibacter sp. TaxID=1906786 RepID=UPI003F7046B6